ncbi:MAG: glycosyltransferase family 2 protein [Pseudomonadota bacterium]
MNPVFTVIIVNYNGGAYLRRCVDALAAQDCRDFEALIVDNGSTDGSLASLPPLDPRFRLIEAGDNLGFAAANNLGAEGARGDWIVTLNPDAFARPGWLTALARAAQRNPGATMLGSMQITADRPDGAPATFDGTGDEYSVYGVAYRAGYGKPLRTYTEDFPVFGPCAAAAAYRREAFEAVGGFDDRFFCYHEDVDLALRMRRLGGRAMQVHDAVVDHVGSGIAGTASDFAVYHGVRNRVWTWAGSMPAGLALGLLPVTGAANLALLVWSAARSGRFKPTARGLWHGITGAPAMIRTRRAWPQGSRALWPVLVKRPSLLTERRNRVDPT